ncbi:MAG: FtsX-like permease family protein [Phycisphaerales bacterium]|nr:FtsX-like permease family protein [Phycisphaerales bacterium]
MYQSLLNRRYLTSKIMPLLSLVAVMLSTGTILVTWSVMGGFLKTLMESGRTLIGDVAITWPNVGFAHYEDLIARLEREPEVSAAAPIIETFGMIRLPDDQLQAVSIRGVDGVSFDRVTGYASTLFWRPLEKPTPKDRARVDLRLPEHTDPSFLGQVLENGLALSRDDGMGPEPAVVPGIELTGLNQRQSWGGYTPMTAMRPTASGQIDVKNIFMPRNGTLTITLLAIDSNGRFADAVTRRFPVANEFQSGIYDADSQIVLARLDALQTMLNMDEAQKTEPGSPFETVIDPDTGEELPAPPRVIGVDPARVTSVLVRAKTGIDSWTLRSVCSRVYGQFASAHRDDVPSEYSIDIRTWQEKNATLISAVEKETGLVLFIFGIVCFTNVFLVLSIFWSMVSEKTKDVGILRALGAGQLGIAWLWLRYGLLIGVVGAVLGVAMAYVIVRNINPIHDWIGQTTGIVIWDPTVYYFIEVPNQMNWTHAVLVFAAGVLTCLIGAAIPAMRAARMDPVKALRFE